MKAKFTPIAMRCNEEQFKAIEPKLRKLNLILNDRITSFNIDEYLTNSFNGNKIVNISHCIKDNHNRKVYETWNEEIFLNACGIETKPSLEDVKEYFKNAKEVKCLFNYNQINITENIVEDIYRGWDGFWISISNHTDLTVKLYSVRENKYAEIISYKEETFQVSKSFILEAHQSACSTLKEKIEKEFPSLFVNEKFKVGKYYKYTGNNRFLFKVEKVKSNGVVGYGVLEKDGSDWVYDWEIAMDSIYGQYMYEATPQEVETALINEAKKRGIWNSPIINTKGDEELKDIYSKTFDFKENVLWSKYGRIFDNGIWAKAIPQPTELTLEQRIENLEKKLCTKVI